MTRALHAHDKQARIEGTTTMRYHEIYCEKCRGWLGPHHAGAHLYRFDDPCGFSTIARSVGAVREIVDRHYSTKHT